jgi:hypothetical protein
LPSIVPIDEPPGFFTVYVTPACVLVSVTVKLPVPGVAQSADGATDTPTALLIALYAYVFVVPVIVAAHDAEEPLRASTR